MHKIRGSGNLDESVDEYKCHVREEFLSRRDLHGPLNARPLNRSSALCPRYTRGRVNSPRNARIVVETRQLLRDDDSDQPISEIQPPCDAKLFFSYKIRCKIQISFELVFDLHNYALCIISYLRHENEKSGRLKNYRIYI